MGFFEIVKGLLRSNMKDILDLVRKRKIEFNPDVSVNPAKYARPIATKKIVADRT